MSTNWHVQAERLKAMYPHWTWGKVCSVVAKCRSLKPKPPSTQGYSNKLEQMKLL